MSKKRTLDSKIRSSQTFFKLSFRQRDLWHGLIAVADDQGRMPGIPAFVRSKIWPYEDLPLNQVEDDLQELQEMGMIYLYEISDQIYLQLINWWKYQNPQWAGPSDYPAPGGWLDRERYHGKEHVIITNNWDTPGGFYINQPINEQFDEKKPPDKLGDLSPKEPKENDLLREEEVNIKDKEELEDNKEGEEEWTPTPFNELIKAFCEKTKLPELSGGGAKKWVDATNRMVERGVEPIDIETAVDELWESDNNYTIIGIQSIENASYSAMAKRKGKKKKNHELTFEERQAKYGKYSE